MSKTYTLPIYEVISAMSTSFKTCRVNSGTSSQSIGFVKQRSARHFLLLVIVPRSCRVNSSIEGHAVFSHG